MNNKKIINSIVKELVCGIVSVEKDAYPRYYDHLDYRKNAEAFIVEAENGELYEVRVTNLKEVQTLNNIIKNQDISLWGNAEEEIKTLETHGCDF